MKRMKACIGSSSNNKKESENKDINMKNMKINLLISKRKKNKKAINNNHIQMLPKNNIKKKIIAIVKINIKKNINISHKNNKPIIIRRMIIIINLKNTLMINP